MVTCSALRRTYRDMLREAAGGVTFVHLDGDLELIARRIGRREGHFMPPSLLASQLATLEPLEPDEPGVRVPIDGRPEEIAALAVERWLGMTAGGRPAWVRPPADTACPGGDYVL
ncbi:hypothetical protein ABZ912_27870 [Nonomuraea angiospora]|uniref:gluconokinase n=1 Tax=Nonomuraea angiospora TaxID=46172 RepID=UPI0033EF315F